MDCAICLENIINDFFITYCSHMFHNKCIKKSLEYKYNCPLCRTLLCKRKTKDGSLRIRYIKKINNGVKWTIFVDQNNRTISSIPLWIS
jgi:hypothetical protein